MKFIYSFLIFLVFSLFITGCSTQSQTLECNSPECFYENIDEFNKIDGTLNNNIEYDLVKYSFDFKIGVIKKSDNYDLMWQIEHFNLSYINTPYYEKNENGELIPKTTEPHDWMVEELSNRKLYFESIKGVLVNCSSNKEQLEFIFNNWNHIGFDEFLKLKCENLPVGFELFQKSMLKLDECDKYDKNNNCSSGFCYGVGFNGVCLNPDSLDDCRFFGMFDKDKCIKSIALLEQNPEVCSKIAPQNSSSSIEMECYGELAAKTNNLDICKHDVMVKRKGRHSDEYELSCIEEYCSVHGKEGWIWCPE